MWVGLQPTSVMCTREAFATIVTSSVLVSTIHCNAQLLGNSAQIHSILFFYTKCQNKWHFFFLWSFKHGYWKALTIILGLIKSTTDVYASFQSEKSALELYLTHNTNYIRSISCKKHSSTMWKFHLTYYITIGRLSIVYSIR